MGKIVGYVLRKIFKYDYYLFFPHLHIGGAENIHEQILKVIHPSKKILIVITKMNKNSSKRKFNKYADIINISKSNDNRNYFNFYLGLFSSFVVNKNTILFGSHSYFYYRLLPFIVKKDNQIAIDLIHSLTTENEIRHHELFIDIETKLDKVICVDDFTFQTVKNHIFNKNKIYLIYNGIDDIYFESIGQIKQLDLNKITVVTVSRNDKVKRLNIVEKVASSVNDATFFVIGSSNYDYINKNIVYKRFINDPSYVRENILNHTLLLLTSKKEGFPLVIAEAMALGLIVISVSVGGIPWHIKNGFNGFLVEDYDDENKIVEEIIILLNNIKKHDLYLISENAKKYASDNFRMSKFNERYNEILCQ